MSDSNRNYVFDPTGLTQVLAEMTGGQTRQYLPGLAQYEAGAWAYQLPDGVGSVRQMVNSSRQLTLWQNYDPFGNLTQIIGSPASSFGYTGEQVDPTGLVFLRARYYNPVTGRFLTPDSLIPDPLSSQAWNRYAYAGNNPIRYTDPSGHCLVAAGVDTVLCAGIIVAGAAFVAYGAYVVTSPTFQDALRGAIQSIPAIPLPPFQLPGTTLEEDINPCYEAGPNIGQSEVWQLPPFPEYGPEKPTISSFPTISGVDVPTIFTIERTPHGEERHEQGDRPTSQAHKDRQNPKEVYIDNETGNMVYVGPNGRTHIFTPEGQHHTSFETSRQNRISRVMSGRWTRLE